MRTESEISSTIEALVKKIQSADFANGNHSAESLKLEREYLTNAVEWLRNYLTEEPSDFSAVTFGLLFLVSVAENSWINRELRPEN